MRLLVIGPAIGVIAGTKNASGVTSSTPSAAPDTLSNERMRPLIAMMNCAGPMVPIESGGNARASARLPPRKLTDALCACFSKRASRPVRALDVGAALGFCLRFVRSTVRYGFSK